MNTYKSIKEYIEAQPKAVQPVLKEMYIVIRAAAPKAAEVIKYGIPTLVGNKSLVHFAAAKTHLGFYPTPSAIKKFVKELAPYKTTKGAVQIPYTSKLPKTLITKMVKFRVQEDTLLV